MQIVKFILLPLFFLISITSASAEPISNIIIYVNGILNSETDVNTGRLKLANILTAEEVCSSDCAVDISYVKTHGVWNDIAELRFTGIVENYSAKLAFSDYVDRSLEKYNQVKLALNEEENEIDSKIVSRLIEIKNEVLESDDPRTNFSFFSSDHQITKNLLEDLTKYSRGFNSKFELANSVVLLTISKEKKSLDDYFFDKYREVLLKVLFSSEDFYGDRTDIGIKVAIASDVEALVAKMKKYIKAGKRVVIVAHSQGNHIIELAHSKLKLELKKELNIDANDHVQVVGLASVAFTTPNDTYLTWDGDHTVLKFYDNFTLGQPLAPNFVAAVGVVDDEYTDHKFAEVYLSPNIVGRYKHNGRGNISELPDDVQDKRYRINRIVAGLIKGSLKKTIQLAHPLIGIKTDVEIFEGDTGEKTLSFEITLNQQEIKEDVTVIAETFDKTAKAGIDYRKTKETIPFKKGPGLRTIKFEVPIIGDTELEDDETFGILLHNASGAVIDENKKQAIGTILNDDEDLPVLSIINQYTITEGNSDTFDINVSVFLNEASTEQVSVDVQFSNGTALAGSDYIAQNTSLTFPPGTTSRNLKVSIVGDTIKESDESFTIAISNVVGATIGNSEAEVLIKDNDLDVLEDTVPPVITLNGDNPMSVTKGETFADPGATALDDIDGVVDVGASGNVDTSTIGTYSITYFASDRADNISTLTRIVNVVELVVTPTIISVLPDTANVYATVAQNFVVTGEDLADGITMSLGNCPSPVLQSGGTSTRRVFRCTPLSTGSKLGTINFNGTELKTFFIDVKEKPDSSSTGKITSPTEGETLQGSTIQVVLNAQDIDGLEKVSLTLKENQPSFVVCEDGTVTECTGTQITRTVAFNPSDYGATEGAVDIGLWVKDESGQVTRVDSVGINWNESIAYDGVPLLIVKVEYTDVKGFVGSDNEWSNRVFSTGSGESVNDYFLENSKGEFKYAPARESNGVLNDGVVKVVLDISHPRGNTIASYRNGAYLETINKAMLNLSDEIDFSQFNTKDIGSGKVTGDELSILFVIAGYDAKHGDNPATWPHAIQCCSQQVSGVSIDSNISVVGEKRTSFSGDILRGIGSIAHELGHTTFDLPDLYARYYNDSKDNDPAGGIGIYGLMGGGSGGGDLSAGVSPSHLSPWSKIKAGLVQPTIVSSDGEYTLNDTASSNYNVLKIPTSRTNEYFLVENRAVNGFDSGMQKEFFRRGSECFVGSGCEYKGGILVWRIDENCPNNDYSNECLKVEPLAQDYSERSRYDGVWGNGENFFHSGMLTEANATSVPSTKFFDGQSSGISISVNDSPSQSMRVNVDVP